MVGTVMPLLQIIVYVSLVICHNYITMISAAKLQNNNRKTKNEWFFNKRKTKNHWFLTKERPKIIGFLTKYRSKRHKTEQKIHQNRLNG
jgi:hypothetical protein